MMPVLADHLWQSTLFAATAAVAAAAMRRSRADVRFGIWLAASLKFLVPFASLSVVGAAIGARWLQPPVPVAPLAAPGSGTVELTPAQFTQVLATFTTPAATEAPDVPFSWATAAAIVWILGTLFVCVRWWAAWRRVAAAARAGSVMTHGRAADTVRRLGGRLPVIECATTLEPGVFGVVRPVLLWPRGISSYLTDEQIEAIVAHELAHAQRRDNVWAAAHMVVQAICWFHPVVWWIGARLVHERERACDEHVLRSGPAPHVYAESLLKTCRFFTASPIPCVPGVTGSDLTRRIEHIMTARTGTAVSPAAKAMLVCAALVTVAAPIVIGGLHAGPLQPAEQEARPEFDVASIKPNTSGEGRVSMRMLPGGSYEATNIAMRPLIQLAYRVSDRQVIGGPSWLDTERYDLLAKSPDGAQQSEFPDRLRTLLEQRLQLKTHRETREMPIYALILARGDGTLGPKIAPSEVDCSPAARGRASAPGPAPGAGAAGRQAMPPQMPALGTEPRPCSLMISPTGIRAGGRTMSDIATNLQTAAGRIVQDRTGLSGSFDFDLEFTRDPSLQSGGPFGALPDGGPRPADTPDGVSIFTAVQEQLGLRLEATTAPVEVLVIDSVERPSEN